MAIKVLVVDDEPSSRQLCLEALEGLGYEMQAVDSPSGALPILEDGQADIVVADVRMPGGSGLDQLRALLEHMVERQRLAAENRLLREQLNTQKGLGNFVGNSPAMQQVYQTVLKVAERRHPVLILGESGTGKELVARAIHAYSPMREKHFVPVDCGSLTSTLIESELFGHVRGAFTGASQARTGLLASAGGGTVFLEDIGELPVELQAKLLRALQEREI